MTEENQRSHDDKLTEIMVGVARVEEKTDAINNRLVALNGSVSTLFDRANDNKSGIEKTMQSLLQHQIDCPGLKTIKELLMEVDRKLFSGQFKGSNEDQSKLEVWEAKQDLKDFKKEWAYPTIKIVAGMIGTLLLYHAAVFIGVIK